MLNSVVKFSFSLELSSNFYLFFGENFLTFLKLFINFFSGRTLKLLEGQTELYAQTTASRTKEAKFMRGKSREYAKAIACYQVLVLKPTTSVCDSYYLTGSYLSGYINI